MVLFCLYNCKAKPLHLQSDTFFIFIILVITSFLLYVLNYLLFLNICILFKQQSCFILFFWFLIIEMAAGHFIVAFWMFFSFALALFHFVRHIVWFTSVCPFIFIIFTKKKKNTVFISSFKCYKNKWDIKLSDQT